MAVITQYVVEHHTYSKQANEKVIFTSKKEADAHDKAFEIADAIQGFLQTAKCEIDEAQLEALALFLARNRDETSTLLKGKKPAEPPKQNTQKSKPETNNTEEPSKDAPSIDMMAKKETEKTIKSAA